ncbi:hypothetical protein [Joostella sp.]|uniref:hypothetical protein n=1 Tax=Joostella sp. TaxID=2231138 RepID=UPI003A8F493D
MKKVLLLLIFSAFLIGCSNDDDNSDLPEIEDATSLKVNTVNGYTNVITDADGRTLYYFSKDVNGESACTSEGCLNTWPPFEVSNIDDLELSDAIDAELIGTVTSPNDSSMLQVTYKGWPLYYYADDESVGDTNGEGVGGVWFVAKTDYNLFTANKLIIDDEDSINYFVDDQGKTLYYFTRDFSGESMCTDNPDSAINGLTCIERWPAYYSEDIVTTSLHESEDFGEITREDGTMQTTYKGWPLYYFYNDENAGDTNGEGAGNVWFVMSPDYNVMLVTKTVNDERQDYIADINGMSLYTFDNDTTMNESVCYDGCAEVWPPFYEEEVVGPSILDTDDFTIFERTDTTGGGDDSNKQISYKGMPLYYFANDNTFGDTNGHGVGDVWFLAEGN